MASINGDDLICLRFLASLGGLKSSINISTQALGEQLGISQQTASRRVLSLEKEGLITKNIESSGQSILISSLGEEYLRREFAEYSKIFSTDDEKYILKGSVVSGVGEGRYYMSIPH
ncbi:MAG: winged helix-turn-helix transcriptional regulator, partial [Methanocorpusculum sp.]|nr:winged helix-turn-helix transcriptional regulator [Methanocorpusculum sp.]